MATSPVKGTRDGNSTVVSFSQQMNDAWALYVQDTFAGAAANTLYRISKWIYFQGGVYTVKVAGDDVVVLYVDSQQIATTGITVTTVDYVTVDEGWHRLDISYTNVPNNTPSYAMYSFYRDGSVVPEFVSTPDSAIGSDTEWPDIGSKPTSDGSSILSLPVWLPEPNWSDGVTETWAWLSTVVTSESGAEQRQKIRRFPRRNVEANFRGLRDKRRAIDMAVVGLGRVEHLVPLWFDQVISRIPVAQGDTTIYGDFNYRNYYAGSVAILRSVDRSDIFNYELVPVLEVHDDHIVLASGVKKDWKSFRLYPVRVAVIDDAVSAANHSNAAADVNVRWRVTTVESFIDPSWSFDGTVFQTNGVDGLPVINLRPNWRDDITWSFDRVVFWTDNQTGVPFVMDAENQETQDWSLPLQLVGKHQKFSFYQLLFAMAGQTQPFYSPNWTEDFTVTEDINPADGYIAVKQNGYSYYNVLLQEIRRHYYLELVDGTVITGRIVSTRAEDGIEYFYLDQTIGSIAKESIRVLCFMPYSRLGSDTVEITHHTELSGPAECMLALHGFIERRDGTPAVFP